MRQWRIAELLSRKRASVSYPFGNKRHNAHAKLQALVLSDQFPRRDPSIVPSEPRGRGCATWPFSLLNGTIHRPFVGAASKKVQVSVRASHFHRVAGETWAILSACGTSLRSRHCSKSVAIGLTTDSGRHWRGMAR